MVLLSKARFASIFELGGLKCRQRSFFLRESVGCDGSRDLAVSWVRFRGYGRYASVRVVFLRFVVSNRFADDRAGQDVCDAFDNKAVHSLQNVDLSVLSLTLHLCRSSARMAELFE